MKTKDLTTKELTILQDFLYSVKNKFYKADHDNDMYFDNDVNFSCSKTEYQALKRAFAKIEDQQLIINH